MHYINVNVISNTTAIVKINKIYITFAVKRYLREIQIDISFNYFGYKT
jgi:hypothetical protein